MTWPPPKVLATQEGEVTVERPHGGAPEVSSVVPGVPQGSGRAAPPLPGATVSVMAATGVPPGWLQHPEALIGCVLGSRYRITSILGRGPMGIACEGESSRGRQVTLKLLPRAPDVSVEHFAWQLRQGLALAHFDHPNVTPISDFGPLDDGGAFASRARVPGVTLRTLLRQGNLPMARALDIARQIASALASAHAQDIAHGRLKPENVIVHGGPRGGDAIKVVDFGLAGLSVDLRAVAPDENEARRLAVRTRLYLPGDATPASAAIDVYSLGVLLFEMIAGRPPFAFESLPPPGTQPAPLGFAQCNPALSVPASVGELVFALLEPRASEHGLNAGRVGQMLDGLLGRPGPSPTAEPATAQLPTAPAKSPGAEAPTAQVPPPDPLAFAAPSASAMVWPSSPAPASQRLHSFPPLPPGVSLSTFPPPAVEAPSAAAAQAAPGTPPPPPSARRPPSRTDEPFATSSFPPAQQHVPHAGPAPAFATPPDATEELDAELRPSLIGRLKRLFGKKRPSEF